MKVDELLDDINEWRKEEQGKAGSWLWGGGIPYKGNSLRIMDEW